MQALHHHHSHPQNISWIIIYLKLNTLYERYLYFSQLYFKMLSHECTSGPKPFSPHSLFPYPILLVPKCFQATPLHFTIAHHSESQSWTSLPFNAQETKLRRYADHIFFQTFLLQQSTIFSIKMICCWNTLYTNSCSLPKRQYFCFQYFWSPHIFAPLSNQWS